MFKEISVGWPRRKYGTISYSREGTRKRFGRGRPVGRPRNRWQDVIQRDAANLLRIQNWKTAAGDKEEGMKKVGEAMAGKLAEAP
jgi:hypothetical protein